MADETRDLVIETRDSTLEPDSWDAEERTIELVWSTGARVLRRSWVDGPYIEELSLEPGAVRLGRLDSGAPLLNSHKSGDLSHVIGVAVPGSTVIEDGEARSTFRLSALENDAPIVEKITSGLVRNVSVGYRVHKWERTEATEDGELAVMRAVDWEPYEVSPVAMGADPGGDVRGEEYASGVADAGAAADFETVLVDPDEIRGKRVTITKIEPAEPAKPPAGKPEETDRGADPMPNENEQILAAERERVREIRALSKRHNLSPKLETELLEGKDGAKPPTVEEARARALDELASREPVIEPQIEAGDTEHEKRCSGMSEALLHRAFPERFELGDNGRQFMGRTLLELAREDLESRGISTRSLSRPRLAGEALRKRTVLGGLHTTDDFPALLADVATKSLRKAYEFRPRTYQMFCSRASAMDFKPMRRIQLGLPDDFEVVPEHEEFKRATFGEESEQYAIVTAGKVIGLTRQLIINDDLSGLARIPAAWGVKAAEYENETVWAILTANANMADGNPLFDATHANLVGAGAAPSVASLDAARLLMRTQTGIDGQGRLRIEPRYILAPETQRTVWEQLLGNLHVPIEPDEAVPNSMRALQVITEPILDDNSALIWYLAADPAMIDTIEYAYLDGEDGVYTETRMGFDVDGIEIKARLDFGAKAIDWRGLVQNPGA